QEQLGPVPQRLAGQGHLQRLPRALVGEAQGLGQALAVVKEVAREEANDALDGGLAGVDADRLAGAADQLLERQGTEVGGDAHAGVAGGVRGGWRGGFTARAPAPCKDGRGLATTRVRAGVLAVWSAAARRRCEWGAARPDPKRRRAAAPHEGRGVVSV